MPVKRLSVVVGRTNIMEVDMFSDEDTAYLEYCDTYEEEFCPECGCSFTDEGCYEIGCMSVDWDKDE